MFRNISVDSKKFATGSEVRHGESERGVSRPNWWGIFLRNKFQISTLNSRNLWYYLASFGIILEVHSLYPPPPRKTPKTQAILRVMGIEPYGMILHFKRSELPLLPVQKVKENYRKVFLLLSSTGNPHGSNNH